MEVKELLEKKSGLLEKVKAIRDELRVKGKEFFLEHYKPLFDKYPEVNGFGWKQYTPYFNDGNECTFGVYNDELDFVDNDGDLVDYYDEGCPVTEEVHDEFRDNFPDLDDEDMEYIFGDHCKVVVYRNKVEVEEYDND